MNKPSAVLDTSCVLSFYMGRKSLDYAAIVQLKTTHCLLVSEETYSEFREVILRSKFDRIPVALRQAFISNYSELVELVNPVISIQICADPKDDKFLSLAVSGNASLLLTRDEHLLRLHPFRGIDILSPATYLAHFI